MRSTEPSKRSRNKTLSIRAEALRISVIQFCQPISLSRLLISYNPVTTFATKKQYIFKKIYRPELAFSPRLPTVLAPVAAGAASQRVPLPALRSSCPPKLYAKEDSEGGNAAEGDRRESNGVVEVSIQIVREAVPPTQYAILNTQYASQNKGLHCPSRHLIVLQVVFSRPPCRGTVAAGLLAGNNPLSRRAGNQTRGNLLSLRV